MASCLLVSDTSTELSYILPSEAAKKGAFERLFQVWGAGRDCVWPEGVGAGPAEARLRQGAGPPTGVGEGGGARCRSRGAARLTQHRLSQHLECSLDSLHLSSFGLMDTTLEEVFLKVSEEDQSLENSEAGEAP